ncbi:cyclin-dependent kinase inhibitor 5-like isoform X3 [Trifolium pratense]|uniref:cyclin-dependent kinase inhibitor 5-like isoform X3 n=1 Tax=Trifolium pratense TaxID=57577 RepID=UPI001E692352|nr:cyclin-dependent kinase inhibitor 5-like isoform X3 [Trifolium pratense]
MGKYIKKAKPKSELALVDSTTKITTTATTTTTTYFGVRTRAKILALQKSNTQNHDIPLSADSYLQLRSRRLKKTRIAQHSNKKKNKSQIQNPKSPNGNCGSEEKHVQQSPNIEDVSFGENVLDFEGRERYKPPLRCGSLLNGPASTFLIIRYNFDPMTKTPLPGRYEWEKLTP